MLSNVAIIMFWSLRKGREDSGRSGLTDENVVLSAHMGLYIGAKDVYAFFREKI